MNENSTHFGDYFGKNENMKIVSAQQVTAKERENGM